MTKYVRNNARLTSSIFGGDCCRPMACLRMARTVMINGKQVTIMPMAGARLSHRHQHEQLDASGRQVALEWKPVEGLAEGRRGEQQAQNAKYE